MLCKLEFPMYFYGGVLNVWRGLSMFLGEKNSVCCSGHEQAFVLEQVL